MPAKSAPIYCHVALICYGSCAREIFGSAGFAFCPGLAHPRAAATL